jgi:type II secretory pathway pseudopilin PulG
MTAVILIIVILMGFIFTAGQNVLDRSRKVQAKNDETSIVTAVNAYYTEYGKYPLDSSKQGYDTLLGDPGGSYDNAFIFNILRAIADSNWNSSNVLNPRKVVFFREQMQKSHPNQRAGLRLRTQRRRMVQRLDGGLVDPWGNEYLVSVDCDYDSYTQAFISYTDLTYTTVTAGSGTWPAVNVSCFAES